MYLEKFEKFGIKQFLFDIFSSQTSIINQVLSQVPQSQADDYISFTQIDNLIEESLQFDPPPTTDFLGFQTGKGKKIEIDNKEIEKALKLFDDKEDIKIDKIFFEPNKNNNNNNNLQKSIRNSNILYGSTQNNKVNSFGLKEIKETDEKILDHEKNCSISKEISSSTFSIFPILKEAKETGYLETSNEKQLDNMNFPGFQTARGNIMKIDEKKLKNAERLFNEEEKPKLGFIHTEFEAFSGFQTAKGASIEINAKKLNEAEEFFKEKENPLQMKKIERKSSFNPTKLEAFSGFQTAKGTSIEINERKLNEAENLFKEKENHFQGKENYRKKPEKNLLFPKKKTPETLLLHNNKKEKPENSIIYNNKQVNPENLLLSNNKKNFETRNFEKLSIKKTPSKTLFLDFKNKKKKIENQKEMENNQFLLNKADSGISHSKIFTKSSEKLKISKPTSKRIVSEQSQKFSFFNNKKPEIYIKKRSFEDFIEENKMIVSPQICQKPSTKQKKSDKINEILTKSPNLIFNLETKGILSLMNKSKTPIKLTSLSIIPVLNANKEFEINETSAGNFNFICECMNLSQINTEKCLCKGKFLINFDWFHKFLEEKFEKMNITQVKYIIFVIF